MHAKRLFGFGACALGFLLQLAPLHAATVVWTGAGDGVSWYNPNNWSNSIPPVVTDAVVITGVSVTTTITISSNVAVQSVQCSASLNVSAGYLSLARGASQVAGTFTIGPDQSLIVSGSNTTLVASGPANINSANLTVSAGASVALPGVQNYLKDCNSPNWTVTGFNSVLSLPGLTNISGSPCSNPTIQAAAGGQILATNLTSITVGPLAILADGTNSLIDFRGLTNANGESGYQLTFTAQNGGAIWVPQLTGGTLVDVTLNPGGAMPTAQFQQLYALSFSSVAANFNALTNLTVLAVNGTSMSFPAVTNFSGGSVTVSGGASVTFPAVQNILKDCNLDPDWMVTGSNSMLSFPSLTNMAGSVCGYHTIQANAGGKILATNLQSIAVAPLTLLADGTNSVIDFRGLTSGAGQSGYLLSLVAQNGGSVFVPRFAGGPLVGVTLNPGGSLPTAQMQQLGGITLNGVAANFNQLTTLAGQTTIFGVTNSFPAVTTFDGGNITVSGGAAVTLPAVQNFVKDCNSPNWTATGSNSVLSLPALTNITGSACSYPVIQATVGGQILATNLQSITVGPLTIFADGAGSVVNLSGLRTGAGESGYLLTLEAQNGGKVWVPQFAGGPLVGVTLNPGGVIPTSQIQQLGGITASGVTLNFSSVTNFDFGNISVSGGAVVTLPAVQSFAKDCNSPYWTVTGSNSVLSLPGLTNLTGNACSYPLIQATSGGQILATNLENITVGPLTLLADGAGSLINLAGLRTASGLNGYLLSFVAKNGGTNWVPQLAGGPFVNVTLNPGGVMPIAQFQQLGGITLSNITASFPSLTNFNGGNLNLGGGAVLTLPVLQNFVKDCYSPNWMVTGSNTVLSLPGLTNLTGVSCSFPTIEATAGGLIVATNLATISAGPLTFLADGPGSLINLEGLTAATGEPGYPLTFVAQNQGAIGMPSCGVVNLVAVTAQSGGQINMSLVQGLSGASCALTANGAGSVIDLSSLSGFATPLGASTLTATNGGTTLLTNSVFLLEDVAVNWAGSMILPPVATATNTLSLYGQPWHSYRVEVLDTRNLGNSWQFYTRVPLTNAVQVIGGVPKSWQNFRVHEFVADPPILDLNIVGKQSGQIVLYARTNQTCRVDTATDLAGMILWQPWSSDIAMTNSFRIFAPTALTAPAQFFRGRKL